MPYPAKLAMLSAALLQAVPAESAVRRNPVRPKAAVAHRAPPAPRAVLAPVGPMVDAGGLPTFEEAPAPLAPRQFAPAPTSLEPLIKASFDAHCPQSLVTIGSEARLVAFDGKFAPEVRSPDPLTQQVGLEAYRRCIDRAIAAVTSSRNYVIRNPEDDDCVDCDVLISELALQLPRLRVIKGLTYLAPARIADQDSTQALATLRQGIADFAGVQDAFARRAKLAFLLKGQALRQEQREAERRALAQTRGAAMGAILGTGLGMAMGLGTRQSIDLANGVAQGQFGQINAELAEREQSVAERQTAIDTTRAGMFSALGYGAWGDDGFRVTLPRIAADHVTDKGAQGAWSFGAMTPLFHAYRIVRLTNANGWCTGSIVGPRLILTNRHCVATGNGNGQMRPVNEFRVEWRYVNHGDSALNADSVPARVVQTVTSSLSDPIHLASDNDWAFLVTREKIGAGWLQLADPAEVAKAGELRVAVAGYSSDLNEGTEITMDWGCRARRVGEGLFHRCRSWKGSSGSPIVAVDGKFPRNSIIGVHASAYGNVSTGADQGLRGGASSQQMYDTWVSLREEQKGDE